MVGTTCYSFQTLKLKIVAVLFFFNASYFRGRTSFFGLVHLWRPVTPVQNLTRPISSTFSELPGREVSHGPILDIFSLSKFRGIIVLAFFVFAPFNQKLLMWRIQISKHMRKSKRFLTAYQLYNRADWTVLRICFQELSIQVTCVPRGCW